jgi:DNA-binding transcriptional ArsR family regulator
VTSDRAKDRTAAGVSERVHVHLDARRLRALAHPMRVKILDLLTLDGPATATGLADRLGVRTGTTSWHLLKLAEHGLVEEATDLGNRRDRWWRSCRDGWSLNNEDFVDDPELADAADVLLSAVIGQHMLRATQFLQEDWPKAWRKAWILTSEHELRLTPARLMAMRAELWAVIDRYRSSPSTAKTAESVVFQMQGFPYVRSPRR